MYTQTVEIGPELALEYLKKIVINRPLIRATVDFFAKQIAEGKWPETHQGIAFCKSGALIDGQHRLHAIVKSGKSVKMLVTTGVDDDAFKYIDTGRKRIASDVLFLEGFNNSSTVAAIARKILLYESGSKRTSARSQDSTSSQITNNDILSFAKKNKEFLYICTNLGEKYYRHNKCFTKSGWAFLVYLFYRINSDHCLSFLGKFSSGLELTSDSPVYVLRKRIESQTSGKRMRESHMLAITIKAWNAFRLNRKLSQLKFNDDEAFPIPI